MYAGTSLRILVNLNVMKVGLVLLNYLLATMLLYTPAADSAEYFLSIDLIHCKRYTIAD